MLGEIRIGRYYSISSKIHTMNPVAKIIAFMVITLLILLSSDIMLTLPIIILLFGTFLSKIPYKIYLETVKDSKTLLLLIFVIFLLLGPITSIIITIKAIIIILFLAILTLTTPTTEIIYGLEKVLYPLNRFKIRTNIVALNIGLSLKFIPYLIDSRNNILKTQTSRGINYKSNFKNYIKAMKNMYVPAFKIAKSKHNNIKKSMYMRLYSIDKERCNFRMNNWKTFDTMVIITTNLTLVITILKGLII